MTNCEICKTPLVKKQVYVLAK